MRFPTKTAFLLFVTVSLLAACDVEVEEQGEMPQVDVDGDPGTMPEYEVTKTEEGEMPSVDVDAESGELPEVDVEGPDIDVGTEPVTVPVPDIDVDMPDETEDTSAQQQ